MEKSLIKFQYNKIEITSISSFAKIRGRYQFPYKDIYFLRALGYHRELEKELQELDILSIDKDLYYIRLINLSHAPSPQEVCYYQKIYENWEKDKEKGIFIKSIEKNQNQQGMLSFLVSFACQKILKEYLNIFPKSSVSMQRNFIVKLLYWLDTNLSLILSKWKPDMIVKIVAHNIYKEQEYLFYYLLTLLGMDVLCIQNEKDILLESLKKLSDSFILGEYKSFPIPAYRKIEYNQIEYNNTEDKKERENANHIKISKSKFIRLDRETKKEVEREIKKEANNSEKKELTFEELATLGSSIVMIGIYNKKKELISMGSGIMIGKKGYILTNHHVINTGYSYSIRIEEEDTIYSTDELIKYNPILDLAILRMQRSLDPLPIYQGKSKLVRGQKVVAIGSPLGLFNSVSDGIISGFRKINDVDMIQFTAPISNGSSGGAVLNMYGEVIGISTAGFDQGQNINLAIGYEFIREFVRGFTE